MKDKIIDNIGCNYRLSTRFSLLGMLSKSVYKHLDSLSLLPEEENGCKNKAKVMHGVLYSDKTVLKEEKSRKKNMEKLLENLWKDFHNRK